MKKRFVSLVFLLLLCCIVLVLPVTAANPPVADAGSNDVRIVNTPVQFNGRGSSDSDGTIVSYAWDFGDSISGTGAETSHIYPAEGTYTATLTVTDNDGLTGSDTCEKSVFKRFIEVTKSASESLIGVGDPVMYTYRVVNFGNTPFFDPVLTDDKLGVIAGPISGDIDNDGVIDCLELGSLGHPGETWTYTTTTMLSEDTTNTATFTGLDIARNPVKLTSNPVTVRVKTPVSVPVKVRILPKTLNTASKGKFVAFITLPSTYKAADVDAKSVVCEGAPAIRLIRIKAFSNTFAALFNRDQLEILKPQDKVQLTVTGSINKNGQKVGFSGSDTIKIISKKGAAKETIDDVDTMTEEKVFSQFNPQ